MGQKKAAVEINLVVAVILSAILFILLITIGFAIYSKILG